MTPLLFILAVLVEPPGPITQQPWDYIEELEFVDPKSLEEIEKELNQKRYRIMEAKPNG